MTPSPILATYRVQLHAGFGFADAAAVAPQLARLGVTHLYLSPVLKHSPGSMHGYDVVDHSEVDPELGGRDGLESLARVAHGLGLGIVVDIVPNHMCVGAPQDLNAAWWAVLRDGPAASSADWFDIDWDAGGGKVLLPILGDGDTHDDYVLTGPVRRYHEHVLPADDSHYRLVSWRAAANYRRFFDVTTLAGLRVEDEAVFAATHQLLLDLRAEGVIDGFRIDHPDGLADPRGYLERLSRAGGGAWTVVEKILEHGEHLRGEWQCSGTTGYDAIRLLDGVLLDPAGEQPLDVLWRQVDRTPWPTVVEASKRLVLDSVLAPERARLAATLPNPALVEALDELVLAMPVYRTYLEPDRTPAPSDLLLLVAARKTALAVRPDLADALNDVVELLVTGDPITARLFQQLTGPVMAKAVEDTAMYRYHRLVALNEVGGNPGQWGVSPLEWHAACAHRQRNWPETLNALSTHDTKRSHDVRSRLLGLAELPERWAELSAVSMRRLQSLGVPDAATGYLLLQTLVGAWPIGVERLGGYLDKATREAKLHTSWTDRNVEYDSKLADSVRATLSDTALMAHVADFVTELAPIGRRNAVSSLALQLTMPGIPDTYQGGELEDFSLVDPDNRRPVDHALRGRLLDELATCTLTDLADRAADGLPKLALLRAGLGLRRLLPDAFGPTGDYQPLEVEGRNADHVLAFARGGEAATVVSRYTHRLTGWANTAVALPSGRWTDVITGAEHSGRALLSELLAGFPVALLARLP